VPVAHHGTAARAAGQAGTTTLPPGAQGVQHSPPVLVKRSSHLALGSACAAVFYRAPQRGTERHAPLGGNGSVEEPSSFSRFCDCPDDNWIVVLEAVDIVLEKIVLQILCGGGNINSTQGYIA
jgi:hypothetical protein